MRNDLVWEVTAFLQRGMNHCQNQDYELCFVLGDPGAGGCHWARWSVPIFPYCVGTSRWQSQWGVVNNVPVS